MIHIVGLGPGSFASLPLRAFALLTGGLPVCLRTARHPVVMAGPLAEALGALPEGVVTALDDEYETGETFADTYAAIVERVLRAAANFGEIVYAVPGHPLVGEATVARLLPEAKRRGIPTAVVGAPSFVDACLEALGEAVTGDLHVVDALTLDPAGPGGSPALAAAGPFLLYQVHERTVASQVKLALMQAGFPDEFPVTIVRSAGLPEAHLRVAALYELDRSPDFDHLTSIWVTALPPAQRKPDFSALVRVMARLRDPDGGCPWDLKQTHESLRRYVLEEAYEVAEAIDSGDPDQLCDELGDLLLQVVFHAQLAAEEGIFDSGDVCAAIVAKLIRRHPHIFGDVTARTPDDVLQNWEAIKAAERGGARRESLLDGVPTSLPALSQALEISQRVVKVGFEWAAIDDVFAKVAEELEEVRAEIAAGASISRVAEELGDLLFTVVNLARRAGVDPEDALRRQLARFAARWRHIEAGAAAQNRAVATMTLAEMEALWRDAKRAEKGDEE